MKAGKIDYEAKERKAWVMSETPAPHPA